MSLLPTDVDPVDETAAVMAPKTKERATRRRSKQYRYTVEEMTCRPHIQRLRRNGWRRGWKTDQSDPVAETDEGTRGKEGPKATGDKGERDQ